MARTDEQREASDTLASTTQQNGAVAIVQRPIAAA
jgi:hypothetical protein